MFYIGRSDKTPKALPDPLWLEQFNLLSGNLCVLQYILKSQREVLCPAFQFPIEKSQTIAFDGRISYVA